MKTALALLLMTDGVPALNVEQIGKLLNIAPRTVQNRIYDKARPLPFPVWKEGGDHFAHVDDVAAYIDQRRAEASREAVTP